MKDFVVREWQRALSILPSAKKLANTDPDSAASRAYYAAFHALTALFIFRGRGPPMADGKLVVVLFAKCCNGPTNRGLLRYDALAYYGIMPEHVPQIVK